MELATAAGLAERIISKNLATRRGEVRHGRERQVQQPPYNGGFADLTEVGIEELQHPG